MIFSDFPLFLYGLYLTTAAAAWQATRIRIVSVFHHWTQENEAFGTNDGVQNGVTLMMIKKP